MRRSLLALLGFISVWASAVEVDLTRYDRASGIAIEQKDDSLAATWQAGGQPARLELNLAPDAGLIRLLEIGGAKAAANCDVEFVVTVGSRTPPKSPVNAFPYVFFDKPAGRKHDRIAAELKKSRAAVESKGTRTAIRIGSMTAGPLAGDLIIHLHAGSALIRVEAALKASGQNLAYIYDALLVTDSHKPVYEDVAGKIQRPRMTENVTPLAVRYRTIVAETDDAAIAIFPAPHAFFFPRDRTDNFKFAQAGAGWIGLRQDPAGGGAFVPWFDAPDGKVQRMDFFMLPVKGGAPEALAAAKRYTNSDRFKPIDGMLTFTSHFHSRLAVGEMAGKKPTAELALVFKQMGVNMAHLAEFHGDGHWNDPGPLRLPEMKAMFDLCRKYSDGQLLLIPGEEGIRFMAHPWPPAQGIHPGHWMYLFPRPVYLTFTRGEGVPFAEEVEGYGKVYHVGDRDDMTRVLREEKGMGWTTHPRVKASFATPDAFKDQEFYKELWLGGAWKAMPADLSDDRLGRRCLDLLDDMSNWAVTGGYALKRLPGEVDVFEIDRTHELYGHMNVNYLKLAKLPTPDDWSPVLDVLKRGDFFTTTGEILIHSFLIKDGYVVVDMEWTFPPAFAEIITGDGKAIKRQRIDLSDQAELGRKTFTWNLDNPGARWTRLEVWDIARNGAYTQPR